jgi:hypothetical protein
MQQHPVLRASRSPAEPPPQPPPPPAAATQSGQHRDPRNNPHPRFHTCPPTVPGPSDDKSSTVPSYTDNSIALTASGATPVAE